MTSSPLREARMQDEFNQRCGVLRERLQSKDFLANRGLGNEVGFYLFCYDPSLELHARDFVRHLTHDAEADILPCRIVEHNLYDVLLRICERKRILDKIPAQEERRGLEALQRQLQRAADVSEFTNEMSQEPHKPGDAVLLTGVGEVYPLLRLHGLFERLQQRELFDDVPVIAFYPGTYNGRSMSLFGCLPDANYYRAFDLL